MMTSHEGVEGLQLSLLSCEYDPMKAQTSRLFTSRTQQATGRANDSQDIADMLPEPYNQGAAVFAPKQHSRFKGKKASISFARDRLAHSFEYQQLKVYFCLALGTSTSATPYVLQ